LGYYIGEPGLLECDGLAGKPVRREALRRRKEAEQKRQEDQKREEEERKKREERQCILRNDCWAYNRTRDKGITDRLRDAAALMFEEFYAHPDIASMTPESVAAYHRALDAKYVKAYACNIDRLAAEQPKQAAPEPPQPAPLPRPPPKSPYRHKSPWD